MSDGEIVKLKDGYEAEIILDSDCEMPFKDDSGVKICVLSRDYIDPSDGELGSDLEQVDEWAEQNKAEWFTVPLWVYDHSDRVYRASASNPFECTWDSARAGLVALKRSDWGNGAESEGKMLESAQSIAETYTSWANGDTYRFVVRDEDGTEVDTCGGYIGRDAAIDGLSDAGFELLPQVSKASFTP